MKTQLITAALLTAFIFSSCEKEDKTEDYDCLESSISFNENNEFISHEKYFYKNELLVKTDYSYKNSSSIFNYKYDEKGNKIKTITGDGSYFIYHYDSENRCNQEEQFVKDTLYLRTYKLYSGTLLKKEIGVWPKGDTASVDNYYYNSENKTDSIISNNSKTFYKYTSNKQTITKTRNNNIFFESTTEFENGLVCKFEELNYNDNSQMIKSFKEEKEFDANKNLLKQIIKEIDYSSNNSYYTENRSSYDSMGRTMKIESYNNQGQLLSYILYIYDGENLVKKQSYDSSGNKTGYTIVNNTCRTKH